jgi:hypothetical protein
MAANMPQMGGPGQMMPQQQRRPQSAQIQAYVYQDMLKHNPSQMHEGQAGITTNDRMGKVMNLCVHSHALSLILSRV